jgi:hypothetical protein
VAARGFIFFVRVLDLDKMGTSIQNCQSSDNLQHGDRHKTGANMTLKPHATLPLTGATAGFVKIGRR